MRDIDAMIDEALGEEERALLHSIGEEPGFFREALGVFGGPTGWVSMVMMGAQAATFIAGVWATWHFFAAQDSLLALRWGLPGAVLLLTSLMIKMAVLPQMHSNRVIRELKRIELQIVRGRSQNT